MIHREIIMKKKFLYNLYKDWYLILRMKSNDCRN